MFSIKIPSVDLKNRATNTLNLTIKDYYGAASTLCGGCGHDSVTAAIIQAFYELAIPPHQVVKMSGIGCSSKTPAYFLGSAHGFNAVHGRMPSVTTGANAAASNLKYLAVSGDGDTTSIGLGQFMHAMRRGLNMVYIVENNGVYGLTKGQFSATADVGSLPKKGSPNLFNPIDSASLAIQMGAGFVARSFSGDKTQLIPLIKAALSHKGFCLIDALSPCVSFNNHEGSTKSYQYIRLHQEENIEVEEFNLYNEEISVNYAPGEKVQVDLHHGAKITLRKADPDYDPYSRENALSMISKAHQKGEILTGLLYLNKDPQEFHTLQDTTDKPLRDLSYQELCPGRDALMKLQYNLR